MQNPWARSDLRILLFNLLSKCVLSTHSATLSAYAHGCTGRSQTHIIPCVQNSIETEQPLIAGDLHQHLDDSSIPLSEQQTIGPSILLLNCCQMDVLPSLGSSWAVSVNQYIKLAIDKEALRVLFSASLLAKVQVSLRDRSLILITLPVWLLIYLSWGRCRYLSNTKSSRFPGSLD
ncbi:hypothetical protein NPIL_277421 [Nephila pilipes]|uniref:Uncharacterized protein n=1 Tax=Nephila pilipes TaxID=299642 RepID=A0A8X6NMB7_NEPPI|nr:hypothetical protein NPIL_277421 [Nephila pilipes]